MISDGLWGQVAKHASEQQQVDITQEHYFTMTITTIVLAQSSPVRCDRTLDTDSTSESSDSWFCSKTRTAEVEEVGSTLPTSTTSTTSTTMAAEANSATVAAEATSAPVASEADFDVDQETKDEQKEQKVTAESTKDAAAEDAKNNEAAKNNVADDDTKNSKPSAADDEKNKGQDDQLGRLEQEQEELGMGKSRMAQEGCAEPLQGSTTAPE